LRPVRCHRGGPCSDGAVAPSVTPTMATAVFSRRPECAARGACGRRDHVSPRRPSSGGKRAPFSGVFHGCGRIRARSENVRHQNQERDASEASSEGAGSPGPRLAGASPACQRPPRRSHKQRPHPGSDPSGTVGYPTSVTRIRGSLRGWGRPGGPSWRHSTPPTVAGTVVRSSTVRRATCDEMLDSISRM
jgi:hypothetical protein